ncbi:hypothetical protein QTP88_004971 [Uroleucon formosanum]
MVLVDGPMRKFVVSENMEVAQPCRCKKALTGPNLFNEKFHIIKLEEKLLFDALTHAFPANKNSLYLRVFYFYHPFSPQSVPRRDI